MEWNRFELISVLIFFQKNKQDLKYIVLRHEITHILDRKFHLQSAIVPECS